MITMLIYSFPNHCIERDAERKTKDLSTLLLDKPHSTIYKTCNGNLALYWSYILAIENRCQ